MSGIPLLTLIRPAVQHIAATYRAAGGAAPEAMMAGIGLQESGFEARDQLELLNGKLVPGAVGPATGFWQFERGGGVKGVMTHPASRDAARALAAAAGVPFDADAIWRHFATIEGDELAAAFARLLLLTDPVSLPAAELTSEEAAFLCYLRNWRPGAWFNNPEDSPKRIELRTRWARNWAAAIAVVRANPADGGVMAPPPEMHSRLSRIEQIIMNMASALRG